MAKMLKIGKVFAGEIVRGPLAVDLELLEKQMDWLAVQPDCDEKEGLLNMLGDIADLGEGG
jgi:hypothetical protein